VAAAKDVARKLVAEPVMLLVTVEFQAVELAATEVEVEMGADDDDDAALVELAAADDEDEVSLTRPPVTEYAAAQAAKSIALGQHQVPAALSAAQ
jgi:hypothetical protein